MTDRRLGGIGATLVATLAFASWMPCARALAAPVRGLQQIGTFATPRHGPTDRLYGFGSDGGRRLFFGHSDGRVTVTSTHGKQLGEWPTLITDASVATEAYSLAVSRAGEVAVARMYVDRVERYDATGKLLGILSGPLVKTPQLRFAHGLRAGLVNVNPSRGASASLSRVETVSRDVHAHGTGKAAPAALSRRAPFLRRCDSAHV